MKLIVADMVPDALRTFMTKIKPDAQITLAPDFDHVLRCAEQMPDAALAMLHVDMPGIDGARGLDVMRARFPGLPVVLVSDQADGAQVRDALRGGASGFIPHNLNGEAMLMALELVLSGGTYLPADLLLESGALRPRPLVGQG